MALWALERRNFLKIRHFVGSYDDPKVVQWWLEDPFFEK